MEVAVARKARWYAVWLCAGVLASALGSTPVLAACGRPRVVVDGSQEERAAACGALAEVLRYFDQGNLSIDLELTIQFRREVYLEMANPVTKETRLVRVSGRYLVGAKELQMTSFNSRWVLQRKPWGLEWDADMSRSILQHEIIHATMAQLMGANYGKLPHALHEALAYAVQIDLMPPDLRARVLEQYPLEEGFANTLQINDLTYGFNPDVFAVAAYKTYIKNGGLDFLKSAMALKLDIIDVGTVMQ